MTKALADIDERLVSDISKIRLVYDISEMNHKCLRSIKVQLRSK